MGLINFHFRMEEKMYDDFKRQADSEHRNMTELIRGILSDYLRKERWKTNQQEIEENEKKDL